MQKRILLTGATGYVGIHLLSNLLRQKNVDQIYCITRHKDHDSFWSSLTSSADRYNINVNVSDAKSKTELVKIDLVGNHDSLLPVLEKYNQTVNVIYHMACNTTYGLPIEYFQPWMNTAKTLIQYCMNSRYPKHLYATGSYGYNIPQCQHTSEDYYWINGYFRFKGWLHSYMLEKTSQGLRGTLFEPGYIVDTVDPGQTYLFWRIARIFATLRCAFKYPMVCTTIDMLIDNYILAMNYPDMNPRIIKPIIPQYIYVHETLSKLLPDLNLVDYEDFRDTIKQRMPKKIKYFGPNMVRSIESQKIHPIYHPLYNSTKYKNMNVEKYLMNCTSLTNAAKQTDEG